MDSIGRLKEWFDDNWTQEDMEGISRNDFIETIKNQFEQNFNKAVEQVARDHFDQFINTEFWGEGNIPTFTIRNSLGKFISWWRGG